MLSEWKAKQEELKEILGSEYEDNNLVICSEYGGPVEENAIKKKFDKLIRENGLRKVVFHSIRHTSITYKLRLTGGDVKAVQGDSGHAQTSMVTDVYSHILDENRIRNAEEVEAAFYSGKALEHQKKTIPADTEDNMKVIANLLQNKELMAVIKTMMG
jgi:integrase